jgi:hypothetical protein
MRYSELKFNGKVYTNSSQINEILEKEKFFWLIDSEIENANIEINQIITNFVTGKSFTTNTLIWHDGDYLTGDWYYGIFKNGNFYGIWENGIFENGNFKGKWLDGIKL